MNATDKQTAQRLANSTTLPALFEHLNNWKTALDTDKRKKQEIAIAQLAITLGDN